MSNMWHDDSGLGKVSSSFVGKGEWNGGTEMVGTETESMS